MSSILRLSLAIGLAVIGLLAYGGQNINPERFGLDPTVTLTHESWNNVEFTGSDIPSISAAVTKQIGIPSGECERRILLWLGNSQLHFINQFQPGDHTAPYWLRKASRCSNDFVPLGVSLPNANLQEHLVLMEYVADRLPIAGLILELTFDDLREDGLRSDFADLISPGDREQLVQTRAGKEILDRADAEWHGQKPGSESAGLDGFVQKHVEDRLNAALSSGWTLWGERGDLRNTLLTDLYYFRNYVLGIKATTIRKMIPLRYQRNMAALRTILEDAARRKIPVLVYIAPIRQDRPLPYDLGEYEIWKREVDVLARETGARLVNLETLVPGDQWGSYVGEDIDFMHFRGKGHQLLADAISAALSSDHE